MMTGLQAGLFQLAAPRERSIQNQPNRLTRQRSRRHYEEAPGFALIYAAAGFRCACVISTFCAAQRSWAETAEKRCVGTDGVETRILGGGIRFRGNAEILSVNPWPFPALSRPPPPFPCVPLMFLPSFSSPPPSFTLPRI